MKSVLDKANWVEEKVSGMVYCEWEESSVIGTGDLERRLVLSISCLKSDILLISSSFRVPRSSLEAKIVLLKQASVSVL